MQLNWRICFLNSVFFFQAVAWAQYDHPGYLASVEEERYQVAREIIIVPYAQPQEVSLQERIFTEKLTKEIRKQYEDRFGRTETEQLENASNRFLEINGGGRLASYNEHLEKQEKFGKYMAKELAEYHTDNYLKNDRSTRKIYVAKEKISNVNVQMSGGYKMKLRYKLSANTLEFSANKPENRFNNRLLIDMSDADAQLFFTYDLDKQVQLLTNYAFENEVFSLGATRQLTASLRTSVTGQRFNKTFGETNKQDRVLFGLTWSD